MSRLLTRPELSVLALTTAVLMAGCGTKKSASAAAPDAAGPPVATGGALLLFGSALTSAATVGGADLAASHAAVKSPSPPITATLDGTPAAPDCRGSYPLNAKETVFATADGAGVVNERAPYYAAAAWYCALSQDSGDSDTVHGSFSLASALVCALGDLKFDGSEAGLAKTISVDQACFPPSMIKAIGAASLAVTVNAAAVPAPAAFAQSLAVTLPAPLSGTLNVLFGVATDHIAFATWDNLNGRTEASAGYLDLALGALRFETLTEGYDPAKADSTGSLNRHLRLLVTGAVDATAKFTKVTAVAGVRTTLRNRVGSYLVDFASLKGDPVAGFRTHQYSAGGAAGVFSLNTVENLDKETWPTGPEQPPAVGDERVACFGAGAVTCAGSSGIQLLTAADTAFFLFPTKTFPDSAGYADAAGWAQSPAAVLGFTEVTTAVTQ